MCPVSWIQEWRHREASRTLQEGRRCVAGGLAVTLPRYYYVPRAVRHHATFLWHSIRRSVQRLLAEFQPDAIVGYWTHPDGEVALRIARQLGVPGIVMVGGSDVLVLARQPSRREQIARVLRSADAVVAVSEDLKRHILDLGASAEKVRVVYRGVDAERFKPGDRAEARRKLGLPAEGRVLVWVGRMAPVKAVHVLIDACAILKERGVEVRVCLVGSGELFSNLKAQVGRRELGDRIMFPGPVDHAQLPDWFRAADLTVLPSLSEGVPNVLLESIACGTPFVASGVGGIPEIADERRDRLVEPGDPHVLAEAIEERLSASPPAESRRFLPRTWADSAQQLESIIEQVRREFKPAGNSRQEIPTVAAKVQDRPNPLRQSARRCMCMLLPRCLFLVAGPADSGKVCLTFDDGPHPVHTPKVLDVLKDQGVRATFFLIGERAAANPELVRRIAAEGHAIGHHTYFHKRPGELSARALSEELFKTQQVLTDLTGSPRSLFRPPYGKLTAAKLLRLWRHGQAVVLWSSDPKDFSRQSAREIERWFDDHPPSSGDIVLMHDAFPLAADALRQLIGGARARGLGFTTVDEWTN